MSVTFEGQELQAGRSGADGICTLCGFTYRGPRPIACSSCGQPDQAKELTDRGSRGRSVYSEQLPEGFATGLWLEVHRSILRIARQLASGTVTDPVALSSELYKLLATDESPLVVLYRNNCTLYEVVETLIDSMADLVDEVNGESDA